MAAVFSEHIATKKNFPQICPSPKKIPFSKEVKLNFLNLKDIPCWPAEMGNKGGKLELTDTIVENISATSGLGNSVLTEN